jgi:uncharacterized coiled-coil DUF342 family protein
MAAKAVRGRRDNILRSVGELKDQHETMVSRLDEESAELRRVELLAEKEAGPMKAVVPGLVQDIPSLQP